MQVTSGTSLIMTIGGATGSRAFQAIGSKFVLSGKVHNHAVLRVPEKTSQLIFRGVHGLGSSDQRRNFGYLHNNKMKSKNTNHARMILGRLSEMDQSNGPGETDQEVIV